MPQYAPRPCGHTSSYPQLLVQRWHNHTHAAPRTPFCMQSDPSSIPPLHGLTHMHGYSVHTYSQPDLPAWLAWGAGQVCGHLCSVSAVQAEPPASLKATPISDSSMAPPALSTASP